MREIAKDDVRFFGCGPTLGRTLCSGFGGEEDFPEAWLLRATSSMKAFKPTFWCNGDDFFIVGRREGRKHALSLLRGAYELSKVVTLGPESSQSRTVSFLGRTLTLRQWGIEHESDQQACLARIEGFGIDRC